MAAEEISSPPATYSHTVIRKAAAAGANLIIAHEPTWFNGSDETDWCQNDSVYLAKKKLLDEYHIAIWRFHDHMLCAEETGRTQEFEQRRGTAESDTRKLTPEA